MLFNISVLITEEDWVGCLTKDIFNICFLELMLFKII